MTACREKSTAQGTPWRLLHVKQPTLYLVDDVSRELGISRSRVYALDAQLNPSRTPNGTRVYTRAAIDYLVGVRLARAS
jgi:hypothetical protein